MRLWAICCSIVFVLGGSFALADSTETFSTYLKNLGALTPLIGTEFVPVVQPGGAAFQATSLGVAKTIYGSTVTNGHCAGFNSAGLIVDEGGPCTTGGGGGTVTAGTTNQLAYYPGSAATVSGLTGANNGVLTTSGAGAPQWLASANNGVLATNGSGVPGWLTSANNAVLVTSGAGLPSLSSTLPNALTVPHYINFSTDFSGAMLINSKLWTGTSANDSGGGFTNTYLGPGAGPGSQTGTAYTSNGTLGGENVAIGFIPLLNVTTGGANEAMGGGAGTEITTGGQNLLIGRHAQRNNHAGSNNVALGEFANNGNDSAPAYGIFNLTGHVDNGSGGNGTLLTVTAITGTPLIVGMHINGGSLTSAQCEIISLGTGTGGTGTYNLDCTGNTGSVALTANLVDASQSVMVGANAGYYVADVTPGPCGGGGCANAVAVGFNAYQNGFTGQNNIAVGFQAMQGTVTDITGSNNIAVGGNACNAITTGSSNICIGPTAGSALTTSADNTLIGQFAGFGITTGSGTNVLIGFESGMSITTGTNNTIVGPSTFGAPGITTGSNNTIIGYPGGSLSASLANSIMLCDGAGNCQADYGKTNSGGWTFSGKTYLPSIGTDATKTDATVCEDTTTHQLYFGSGSAGICLGTSSLRFKHDVASLDVGLSQVMALEPISYKVNSDHGDPNKTLYGFSAEQGGTALPALMGKDAQGQPNTFDYMGVVPVLVKAIQQQQAEIDDLKRQLAHQ